MIYYYNAIVKFHSIYPTRKDIHLYSAPGRTEIGGNHTDHQNGCILAAAVNLEIIAVTSFHDDGVIRIYSEGYEPFVISLDELSVHKNETGPAAIVRGIASKFSEIEGFDMYITSDIPEGSGLSSSAAFEMLICNAINSYYYNNSFNNCEIAKIGQYAENAYWGKKCGLMDQLVCATNGFISVDFRNIDFPKIKRINFDFSKSGHKLIITNTNSKHSNISDEYSDITNEMKSVAKYFGKEVLRDVDEEVFWDNIPGVRSRTSDRSVLRSIHFFEENKRAVLEAEALEKDNFEEFLYLVNESGKSSETLLQNIYSTKTPQNQEIALALSVGRKLLGNKGAIRVHGGGFGGTIQAFVPDELEKKYKKTMNNLFGEKSCYVLSIRQKN